MSATECWMWSLQRILGTWVIVAMSNSDGDGCLIMVEQNVVVGCWGDGGVVVILGCW